MSAIRADAVRPFGAVLALAGAVAFAGQASAEAARSAFAHAPFRDAPVAVMRAATLETLTFAGGADVLEGADALYAASLAAADPRLAREVRAALAEGPLPRALADAALAAIAPEPPTAGEAAARRAAVAARLLLAEGGLAESLEASADGDADADGEAGRDAGGDTMDADVRAFARAVLGRVATLAGGLVASLPPAARADASTLLDRLDALLAREGGRGPAAPPEAVERLAQGLVALLERAADADLYLDRDLGGALATVRRLTGEGCAAADPALGAETLAIAARYHEETLSSTFALLAGTAEARADVARTALAEGRARGSACPALLDALDAAGETLSPEERS